RADAPVRECRGEASSERLLHVEKLDVEDERRVGWNDPAGAPLPVGHVRRNNQRAFAADFHAGYAFVPTLDYLALAEKEAERDFAVERAIKFSAMLVRLGIVIYPPRVMHNDRLAFDSLGTTALFYINFLQGRRHGIQLATSLGGCGNGRRLRIGETHSKKCSCRGGDGEGGAGDSRGSWHRKKSSSSAAVWGRPDGHKSACEDVNCSRGSRGRAAGRQVRTGLTKGHVRIPRIGHQGDRRSADFRAFRFALAPVAAGAGS